MKNIFGLLLLSSLTLFLGLMVSQVSAVPEGFCIGEDCVYNWWGTGTTNYLSRWAGSRTIADSVVYQSGTNIGIGTTTPAQKLHVAGYARADSGFCIGTSCITAWPEGEVTGTGTANYLPIWTTGSNIGNSVVYQSGTNVGIGTTSPGGKLGIHQGMSDYATAFTSPHLKLSTSNTVDNTGFVGITYDSSTTANYGWSSGSLRSSNGQADFVWKFHSASAGGTEWMRIKNTGNVGIGMTSPSEKLDVNGNVRANEFYYSSDASLKMGIGYLPGEEMLSKVLQLQGVSFNWKATGEKSIGFIAQDVEKIFPEAVATDANGLKSISYSKLIAPLTEAIKEQQKQIEFLMAEIEQLKQ